MLVKYPSLNTGFPVLDLANRNVSLSGLRGPLFPGLWVFNQSCFLVRLVTTKDKD